MQLELMKKGGRPPKNTDKIEIALKMYESKDCSIKQITAYL